MVAGDDLHLVLQTLAFGLLASEFDEAFGDLDADGARAEILGRGEHDAAVAAAEVIQHFAALQAGRFEHFVDDGDGRDDVRRQLARLTGRTRRLDPPRLAETTNRMAPAANPATPLRVFFMTLSQCRAGGAPLFCFRFYYLADELGDRKPEVARLRDCIFLALKTRTAALMASRHGVTVGVRL